MNSIKTYKIKSIMLVDDDQDDQHFFSEALKYINNTVLFDVAENGKEAIDLLNSRTNFPDCIFLDVNMPVMDGIECLKKLRNNPLTHKIPVVMLTTSIDDKPRAMNLGAHSFLIKPNTVQNLTEMIKNALNKLHGDSGHSENNN